MKLTIPDEMPEEGDAFFSDKGSDNGTEDSTSHGSQSDNHDGEPARRRPTRYGRFVNSWTVRMEELLAPVRSYSHEESVENQMARTYLERRAVEVLPLAIDDE